ncbi:hypothetical protein, partial [uncultured Dialister sp.]|uniref:hypothetical protein n=1 Tax=uncultured Dialister sp. TaxID=278064 RepID=UPI00267019BE
HKVDSCNTDLHKLFYTPVIKYNFVSYIYKIRYFMHSASIGISNINIPYIWNTYLFCRSGKSALGRKF